MRKKPFLFAALALLTLVLQQWLEKLSPELLDYLLKQIFDFCQKNHVVLIRI